MSSEWQSGILGDFIELKRGYDLPRQNRHAGNIPIVSSSGISDYHNASMVRAPGVVTGRYGTLGEVFYIDQDFWPLNTALYVSDFKGNHPRFISYFLKTLDFLAYSDKGAVPGLNRNHLHRALVTLPPIAEQHAIANVLSSLDDKIELNRQINQTLEQMAQALFHCWFVDFEPVKAKAAALTEGRDPLRAAMSTLSGKTDDELNGLTPEVFDTLAATAGLFPNEIEESALGAVPKGWEAERLGAVIELAYGKALPKTDHRLGSVPVYGSGGIGGFHDTAHVAGPGIVIGRKGTVGSVFWIDTDFCAIDTVFYVKLLKPVSLYWAFEQLRRIDIASLGADSAVPGVNRNTVYMQPIVVASQELMQRYQMVVQPLITMRKEQSQQAETLAALRDSLLPKLLSGKLEIAEIE